MATLADLKARIADDLGRSDLTTQIAAAIQDAVDEYKDYRFGFNETVSSAQDFVAGTASYTMPADFLKLDRIVHRQGTNDTPLCVISYDEYLDLVDGVTTNQSQPRYVALYAGKFWFYPTPSSSTDDYVISYLQDLGLPVSDDGQNAWTNQGRNLLRARAKADLNLHVIRNLEEAQAQYTASEAEKLRLIRQESRARGPRRVRARWM